MVAARLVAESNLEVSQLILACNKDIGAVVCLCLMQSMTKFICYCKNYK